MIAEKDTRGSTTPDVNFVHLPDRRRLAYSEYGVPHGKPVLYFHGHPGSRLDLGMFGAERLTQYGLRLIAVDRPGIGQSDFQPGRKITDWPADVAALADALGLERFAVLGISGGGPFAAVTAYALPERVSRLVLVSSVGRFDIPAATAGMGPGLMYFRLGRYAPWLSRLQLKAMAYGVQSDASKVAEQVKLSMPAVDAAAIGQPGVLEAFLDSLREFLRQGVRGPAHEAGLYLRPWGFALEAVRVPTTLWHGLEDRNAPVAMGRDLANRIPNCSASFVPGEGHFSLLTNHTDEIMQALEND